MEVVQSPQLKRKRHVQEVTAGQKNLVHVAVTQIAVQAKDPTEKEMSEIEVRASRQRRRVDQDHGKI